MRRLLRVLTGACLVWAALVYATGGIQWRIAGAMFRSRDPARALLIAAVLVLVQAVAYRRDFIRDVEAAAAWARRAAPWLGALAALVLLLHGLRYGSFIAAGADAYGYVSQAYGWASGHLPAVYPLPLTLPFPSSDLIQAPLGYRPGPAPHTMVPTYAPGLPLMMAAALLLAGAIGPYLIVPICAGLYVWFTFLLGRKADGPIVGIFAAMLAATSPVVLFQTLWPMSDVPAGALWTGALVAGLGTTRRSAALSGIATALGLLVRPNLPVLVMVPLAAVLWNARGRERLLRLVLFCLPIVPVVAIVALLNDKWFGSPLASGYGRTSDLYALASVWPNLQRYPVWLWQSQSPWILAALLAIPAAFRAGPARRVVQLSWLLFVVTTACYIAYFPFEAWWYLRFLIPGLGAFFVLVSIGIITVARRLPRPWGHVAAFVVLLFMVKHATGYALGRSVFGPLKASDHRYADVGEFVSEALPDNAVVFTMQHSGTVRHYGGRLTLRYDFLDPDWTARAPAEIERLGLHPYMVIDDWEVPYVQRQFGFPPDRALPWPYVARMRENGGVTVYDMATTSSRLPPVALSPGRTPRYSGPKTIVLKPH